MLTLKRFQDGGNEMLLIGVLLTQSAHTAFQFHPVLRELVGELLDLFPVTKTILSSLHRQLVTSWL